MTAAPLEIHGHAIVSRDGRIADSTGRTPPALTNDADWALFQAELDRAVLVVLGRLGHEAHPNPKRRPRLVVSSAAAGLERRADAWWWNPAGAAWTDVVGRLAPQGGLVAVPGGRRVFDLFLAVGYDAFHLSRAKLVAIPDGVPLFTGLDAAGGADAMLAAHGLAPDPPKPLAGPGGVALTAWRRP